MTIQFKDERGSGQTIENNKPIVEIILTDEKKRVRFKQEQVSVPQYKGKKMDLPDIKKIVWTVVEEEL